MNSRYNTFVIRWTGFTLNCILAALAGAMFAVNYGFVNPSITARIVRQKSWSPPCSGTGSIYGPFFGTVAFIGLRMCQRLCLRWEWLWDSHDHRLFQVQGRRVGTLQIIAGSSENLWEIFRAKRLRNLSTRSFSREEGNQPMLELYISSIILGCASADPAARFHRHFHRLWIDADHQHGADGLLHFGAYLTYALVTGPEASGWSCAGTWCSGRGFLVETQLLRRFMERAHVTMVSPSASS